MKILVTGSSGHLGEALVRTCRNLGYEVSGLDVKASAFTTVVGSVDDRDVVCQAMDGVDVVYHTATLHKPHVVTHSKKDFINTNVSGTLALLEQAVATGVASFVFTSTTSVYGYALRPTSGSPAVWVTENTQPIPRNIYGITKTTAEDLCRLFHHDHGLACIILRTSRFFPEQDDDLARRENFADANIKVNEFLNRRVELADVVEAHLLASARAQALGFGRYIISATSPFKPEDLAALNTVAPPVVQRRVPEYLDIYNNLGWKMFDTIDRVYVNDAARRDLGWSPKHDFLSVLKTVQKGNSPLGVLSDQVGSKGYHDREFEDGPYPVEK